MYGAWDAATPPQDIMGDHSRAAKNLSEQVFRGERENIAYNVDTFFSQKFDPRFTKTMQALRMRRSKQLHGGVAQAHPSFIGRAVKHALMEINNNPEEAARVKQELEQGKTYSSALRGSDLFDAIVPQMGTMLFGSMAESGSRNATEAIRAAEPAVVASAAQSIISELPSFREQSFHLPRLGVVEVEEDDEVEFNPPDVESSLETQIMQLPPDFQQSVRSTVTTGSIIDLPIPRRASVAPSINQSFAMSLPSMRAPVDLAGSLFRPFDRQDEDDIEERYRNMHESGIIHSEQSEGFIPPLQRSRREGEQSFHSIPAFTSFESGENLPAAAANRYPQGGSSFRQQQEIEVAQEELVNQEARAVPAIARQSPAREEQKEEVKEVIQEVQQEELPVFHQLFSPNPQVAHAVNEAAKAAQEQDESRSQWMKKVTAKKDTFQWLKGTTSQLASAQPDALDVRGYTREQIDAVQRAVELRDYRHTFDTMLTNRNFNWNNGMRNMPFIFQLPGMFRAFSTEYMGRGRNEEIDTKQYEVTVHNNISPFLGDEFQWYTLSSEEIMELLLPAMIAQRMNLHDYTRDVNMKELSTRSFLAVRNMDPQGTRGPLTQYEQILINTFGAVRGGQSGIPATFKDGTDLQSFLDGMHAKPLRTKKAIYDELETKHGLSTQSRQNLQKVAVQTQQEIGQFLHKARQAAVRGDTSQFKQIINSKVKNRLQHVSAMFAESLDRANYFRNNIPAGMSAIQRGNF